MKIRIAVMIIIISILLAGYQFINTKNTEMPKTSQNPNVIRFVAVGDSYTIGLDVDENEAWPTLLTKHLQSDGVQIELTENLAVTGYTASDVIAHELPEYEKLNPQFATILIGANDASLGIDVETFRKNLATILDTMQAKLLRKDYLVVLTIPDYTQTPRGRQFFSDEQFVTSIEKFNEVIKMEAKKRNLTVIDLQNINDGINFDNTYYTADGLHPSGKQYQLWEQRIYLTVKEMLETE